MNILFLTSQIPSPYSGASIRPFHLIINFSKKYKNNIFLISFVTPAQEKYVDKIKKYCQSTLFFPLRQGDSKRILVADALKNFLSITKITSKNGIIDFTYYSRGDVQKKIDKFIESHKFDIVYSDAGMAGYVANSPLPKIVEPLDINYKNWLRRSIKNNGFLVKIYWFIRFLQTMYREIHIYKKFNYCVVVTETDKYNISNYLSNIKIIPNGTDINYFKPMTTKINHPSLIFTGVMSEGKNVKAMLYFHSKIYPIIKKEITKIKLYIVGKEPHPKIWELTKDPSVIVTGFVEDMRPYLSKSSIFICPHISGSGIKNKVLEAMAMGKPVVSTSIGAMGIDILPGENIVIADRSEDFAKQVIELLGSEDLRKKIGSNGRQLVEIKCSWKKTTYILNELIVDMMKNKNVAN